MPRPSRAQRFLRAYNSIEQTLRSLVSADRHLRFYNLVEQAAEVSPAVEAHKNALKEYADLRNAIAHGDPVRPLADPYEETVRGIEAIARVIETPPLLAEAVSVPSVATCSPQTGLITAMTTMRVWDFSQLPVVARRSVTALLTAETVMRYISSRIRDLERITVSSVADALPHAEDPDNFVAVPPTATVFDGLAAFERYSTSGRSLDAILIVDENQESPLTSIVTTFDMPLLLAAARR